MGSWLIVTIEGLRKDKQEEEGKRFLCPGLSNSDWRCAVQALLASWYVNGNLSSSSSQAERWRDWGGKMWRRRGDQELGWRMGELRRRVGGQKENGNGRKFNELEFRGEGDRYRGRRKVNGCGREEKKKKKAPREPGSDLGQASISSTLA